MNTRPCPWPPPGRILPPHRPAPAPADPPTAAKQPHPASPPHPCQHDLRPSGRGRVFGQGQAASTHTCRRDGLISIVLNLTHARLLRSLVRMSQQPMIVPINRKDFSSGDAYQTLIVLQYKRRRRGGLPPCERTTPPTNDGGADLVRRPVDCEVGEHQYQRSRIILAVTVASLCTGLSTEMAAGETQHWGNTSASRGPSTVLQPDSSRVSGRFAVGARGTKRLRGYFASEKRLAACGHLEANGDTALLTAVSA
ncbi:hypothetical protein WN55_06876 [Dufourea novaeangliae]|uniref:Uncharacterized protein n=1 Tax=Dufourea novaeangliae TaxID=178035 RepID=A0A154PQW3_DUFNO|nr:hypothetical protein WN55_06876 [Dufourea novaeangliae]